jgi:regulator of sirC expression with transglutaminase-like and TPR domain
VSTSEISALIQLLLDESPQVREAVANRLLGMGDEALHALEGAARSDNATLRVRARILYHHHLTLAHCAALSRVLVDSRCDLEIACTLLAQVENPEMDAKRITDELERLGGRVREEIIRQRRTRSDAEALGKVLHVEEGFVGNVDDYYDPRNSYLDEVLRRRLGIPISLSAVYMMVGRRAGLTLKGVGMPCHFLVQYEAGQVRSLIDPFTGGRLVSREECKTMLAGFRHSWREDYLRPVEDRDMFRRIMANLIHIYQRRGEERRLNLLYRFVNDLQKGRA